MEDMQKLKIEFTEKREKKLQEESEKKAVLPPPPDPGVKAEENKANLRVRKHEVSESMIAKAEGIEHFVEAEPARR